jgi:hypothetical protein
MIPYSPSALLPNLDLIEQERLTSRRPASRLEIMARHLKEDRRNFTYFSPDNDASATYVSRERTRPTELNPAAKVRRGIGRALVAAGHRIDREAA